MPCGKKVLDNDKQPMLLAARHQDKVKKWTMQL